MVVFFPPSTYTRRRDSPDSDDEPAGATRYYYVRLEAVSSSDDDDGDQRPTARGRRRRRNRHARLILEVPDDDDDDDDYTTDDEEEESDDWDPCLHLGELPLRPMSRFHKAFIDVLFVVATVALEGVFVWTALQQDGAADEVMNWFILVPLMLTVMILIPCLAAYIHLLVTSDFSWRPAPAPAPSDEKV